jgi:hypothetical protein
MWPSSKAESAGSRLQSRSSDGPFSFRPIDQPSELDNFEVEGDDYSFIANIEQCQQVTEKEGPAEWNGANPDGVMAQLKTLKETVYSPFGLRSFCKSYSSWLKLKPYQQD